MQRYMNYTTNKTMGLIITPKQVKRRGYGMSMKMNEPFVNESCKKCS